MPTLGAVEIFATASPTPTPLLASVTATPTIQTAVLAATVKQPLQGLPSIEKRVLGDASNSINTPVLRGEVVTFQVIIRNDTETVLRELAVTDVLPQELQYRGATVTQGTVEYDEATRTVTATIPELAINANATLTIDVDVDLQAGFGTEIVNTASVQSGTQSATSDPTTLIVLPNAIPNTGENTRTQTGWLLGVVSILMFGAFFRLRKQSN